MPPSLAFPLFISLSNYKNCLQYIFLRHPVHFTFYDILWFDILHFTTFYVSWQFMFYNILCFTTFNILQHFTFYILQHLTFYNILHFTTFYISCHFMFKLHSGIVGSFKNQISTFFWALNKHYLTLSWYYICERSIFNAKHLGYVSYITCNMLFTMFHQ